VAWARALGHDEATELLQQTLDEEKAADEKLSGLAEGGINQSATDASQPEDEGEEDEEEEPRPVWSGAKKTVGAKPKPTARRR
jgi:hypothetical protein